MNEGEKVQKVALRLLRKLEQAVRELDMGTVTRKEKVKTEAGEVTTELIQPLAGERGVVDRGGLKQLTGVLKDLQDILLQDPTMEVREREAKLRKLEMELNRDPGAEGVSVVLEGEAADYAG